MGKTEEQLEGYMEIVFINNVNFKQQYNYLHSSWNVLLSANINKHIYVGGCILKTQINNNLTQEYGHMDRTISLFY